ncbi:hypothetical protein WJX74_003362 [Apatococcus lobatus]|uniref:Carrier domain-containing protein n=1 Tax=Apatococcus lobatus TaxID=904363 RepID=A0AAW1RLK8_9CHLO
MAFLTFLNDPDNNCHIFECGTGRQLDRPAIRTTAEGVLRYLRDLKLQKGDAVMLLGSNTTSFFLGFLGILMAESIVCPQTTDKPEGDYSFFLKDMDAKAVLIPKDIPYQAAASAAAALDVPVIFYKLEQAKGEHHMQLTSNAEASQAQRSAAKTPSGKEAGILNYTSGTTGRPKGVMASTHMMAVREEAYQHSIGYSPQDRVGVTIPVASATHKLAITALACGATLLLPSGGHFNCKTFWQEACEYAMTTVVIVPTMLKLLLAEASQTFPAHQTVPLQRFWSIGASLPTSIHDVVRDTFGASVYEMYGLSETGVATYNDPASPQRSRQGTAGLPVPGFGIRIFNSGGELMAKAGESGEICIKSEGVIKSYWHRPDADEASFLGDWFRTGDAGFLDADGFLTVTGRIKELISCGGAEVSPDEVDEVLQQHPEVAEAAAFAVPESMLGQVAEAAVVLGPDSKLSKEEASAVLRKFAGTRLAKHKVPMTIHVVASIPKSSAQKVQRWQLAEQFGGEQGPNRAARDLSSLNVDEEVQGAWTEELGAPPETGSDNFFSSGGSSMQAAALASNLSKRLETSVDSTLVFQQPVVHNMVTSLQEQLTGAQAQAPSDVPAGPQRLSEEQRRAGIPILKSSRANNLTIGRFTDGVKIGIGVNLIGPLDAEALRKSHWALHERHESLRTVIRPQPDGHMPLLLVQPMSEQMCSFNICNADSKQAATAIARDAYRADYNDEKGPMMRIQIIRLSTERHWLIMAVHHGVSDQISMVIMLRDLAAFYNGFVTAQAHNLPQLAVHDTDHTAWVHQKEAAGLFEADKAFWRKTFAAPNSGLAGIDTSEPQSPPEPCSVHIKMPSQTLQHIRSIAQEHHVPAMAVVLAAYSTAAAQVLDRKGVLVNMIVSGRDHPALETMVSCLIHNLPISLPEAGQCGSETMLKTTAARVSSAMQHSIPYGLIKECAGEHMNASTFLYLNADLDMAQSCPEFHGAQASRLDLSNIAPLYGSFLLRGYRRICLFLRADAEGHIVGGLTYHPAYLNGTQADQLLEKFQGLLQSTWSS